MEIVLNKILILISIIDNLEYILVLQEEDLLGGLSDGGT